MAVEVGVELGECSKAISGSAATGQGRGVAKEFGPGVYCAVGVAIKHEETVVGLNPTDGFLHPGVVEVKHDRGDSIDGKGFDAIAVEIQHERVAPDGGDVDGGGGEGGTDKVDNFLWHIPIYGLYIKSIHCL